MLPLVGHVVRCPQPIIEGHVSPIRCPFHNFFVCPWVLVHHPISRYRDPLQSCSGLPFHEKIKIRAPLSFGRDGGSGSSTFSFTFLQIRSGNKRCSTIHVCYGIIHACLLLAVTIHAWAIFISYYASAVQDDPSCCLLSHLLATNCAFRAFDSLIR